MYGNGARIGMAVTPAVHRRTQQDHHPALTVLSVAVAGVTMRGTAVCRIVAAAAQATGTAFSVCAFLFLSINTKILKLS